MSDRPNILWLTYEDTSPQFVSCYGQTPVKTTPTVDRLAADGVRFDNAFATSPVCSASRSAIITGCSNQATGLGNHRSKYPLPRDLIKGFPWYLQDAGYYTTNNKKTDYNISDEADFIEETWHESSENAHWRNREQGQPFFSVFNYMDSHQSRTMTKPWKWYEENVLGQLPPEKVISPEDVAMPPIYRDSDEMRQHLSRVYNSLRLCDLEIEKKLDELREDGLMEDTIIFCFADHGEGIPRGKCNGIGFGYRASFVIWFPEKYKHLSPWGTQTVTDELVSFEDLAPTILSLAGVSIPDYMTGRPFLGDKRQPAPEYMFAGRDRLDDTPDLCRSAIDGRFVYTRNFYPHLPVVKYQKYSDVGGILQAIRRDYKEGKLNEVQAELVKPSRPREYLFDLKNDFWEITNLAEDPDYQQDLERLRNATFDYMRRIQDVMLLPECEMIQRAGESTPYEQRDNPSYNPLDDLIEAADLVGGGEEAVARQVELLNHNDPAVRYWAGVGLYAAGGKLVAPYVNDIRPALDDDAAYVRVEIAAAVYAACRDEKARSVLGNLMEHEEPLVGHQAVEKVLYMPELALDFEDYVNQVHENTKSCGLFSNVFPLQQAVEMYRYLYQGQPLYYPDDRPYLSE